MLFFLVTKLAMLSHLSVCPQVSIVLVVGSIHDREAFAKLGTRKARKRFPPQEIVDGHKQ